MNKLKLNKLFSILLAISSAIILLGVIVYSIWGFNTAPDLPQHYTFEVNYDVVLELNEKEEDLQDLCENVFDANGLKYSNKEVLVSIDSSSFNETTNKMLVYTFDSAKAENLEKAAQAVNAELTKANSVYSDAIVTASWHTLESERFYEYAWRGAIAVAVAAIVALVYVGVRYGVSCAVAGFACCVHDALVTVALMALVRFPVFAYAPLLYAAAAAFLSVFMWVVLSNKIRENLKAPEAASVPSGETIKNTVQDSKKALVTLACVFAGAILVLGGIALFGAAKVALLVLPMLLSVALPLYSTLFIGPEIFVLVRNEFDKKRAQKKAGYVGKKKANATDAK